ncbi:MAG: hypothetical protein WAK55_22290 [Xanthobacteraceae bacterium]
MTFSNVSPCLVGKEFNISTFDNSWNFLGGGKFCLAGSQRGSGENAMTTPEMIVVWAILGLIGFVVALK